jgi:hypothetical protein
MPLGPMDAASQSPVACSIHGFGLGWMNGRQIARAQHPDLAASPSHTFASIYFHLALSLVRSIDRSLALTPHRYLLASLRTNISVENIELFTKKKGAEEFTGKSQLCIRVNKNCSNNIVPCKSPSFQS